MQVKSIPLWTMPTMISEEIENRNDYVQYITVKAFVVTPQNDTKFNNFQRGLRQRL